MNKLSNRILQNVMDVFPQVPASIRKSVDEMTNASLLLFNSRAELIMRRKLFSEYFIGRFQRDALTTGTED